MKCIVELFIELYVLAQNPSKKNKINISFDNCSAAVKWLKEQGFERDNSLPSETLWKNPSKCGYVVGSLQMEKSGEEIIQAIISLEVEERVVSPEMVSFV